MLLSRLKVFYEVLYYSFLLSRQYHICFCGCKFISTVVCFMGSRYSIAYFYVRLRSAYAHKTATVKSTIDLLSLTLQIPLFYQLQIWILYWEGNIILQGHAYIVGVFVVLVHNKTVSWNCFFYLVSVISGFMTIACCLFCVLSLVSVDSSASRICTSLRLNNANSVVQRT